MKPNRNAEANSAGSTGSGAAGDLVVSSRHQAIETLRCEVTLGGSGPILLTGESGAGKTWLWKRLAGDLPPRWRWLSVDMSAALDAREFLELIAHGLGIPAGDRLALARMALARALEEESAEGRSWILVIENTQHASELVWTEVEALIHGMEASAGFSSLILSGPTELTRVLSTRARRSLASRLSTHIHLLPVDLEECRELAQSVLRASQIDRTLLEELHRDAAGNPRRILQLLNRRTRSLAAPVASRPLPASRRRAEFKPGQSVAVSLPAEAPSATPRAETVIPVRETRADLPARLSEPPLTAPLVPTRPPLRVEEGLIEVGWGGSLDAENGSGDEAEIHDQADGPGAATAMEIQDLPAEETIDDHYAALQAWSEWAQNQGRQGSLVPAAMEGQAGSVDPLDSSSEIEADEQEDGVRLSSGLRAESQHEHAPYGPLFSRLRQSK